MAGVMMVVANDCGAEGMGGGKRRKAAAEEEVRIHQVSVLEMLIAAIRRSVASSCRMEQGSRAEDAAVVETAALRHMEIGWPTDVRHIAHVTFDRFRGFLGLPIEFELEVPCRAPSASASVFGVSAESMQCCYDSKGNNVPTILILIQERLYREGGLKAEGIFRINPENSKEEVVREQLNKGIVPDDIDVHCLAGLIKAWFRELPEGVLDGLSPEQVLQCNTEEQCVEVVQQLLPTQAALLNWAVNLMADVVEEEANKMNARNIAMVFAPNMTQMSDPLTALMHAVQVMNLLKTLILKTLREREEEAASCGEGNSRFSSSSASDQEAERGFNSEEEGSEKPSDYDSAGGGGGNCAETKEEETESLIEECFLRQLDWKEDCGDIVGDFARDESREEEESYNTGSCFSSTTKRGSSCTDYDESESEASVCKILKDVAPKASLKKDFKWSLL